MQEFLDTIREAGGLLTEFDEALWRSIIDRMVIHTATKMIVTFQDDNNVVVNI